MLNALRNRFQGRCSDDGVALMTVILVTALVTALTLTISVVATNNLVSARLAQQAGAAVDSSDAGVAQAIAYIRKNGVLDINSCSPTCATNPWGNKTNPATVTIGGKAGQTYKVWIEKLAPYPTTKPGRYRIHSTGIAGGPAGRSVTVDVDVDMIPVTNGIVAASVDGGGSAGVHYESIFSTGCVSGRSKIDFTDPVTGKNTIDRAYGIPAAVHSSGLISTQNGNGSCSGNFIHSTSAPCNATYPYDQDSRGATFVLPRDAACYNKAASEFPTEPQFNTSTNTLAYQYPTTSYMDAGTLANNFSAKRPPFTQAQLDQIKAIAQSDGTYYTTSTYTAPPGPDAVLYFDLTGSHAGETVDLNTLAVAPWNRDHDPLTCPRQSLLVIIAGGNARLNSNSKLSAAVFAISDSPYGNISKANGTATFTGSLYGNNVDLTGTADMWMDQCFLDNPSPALTTVETYHYREVDR